MKYILKINNYGAYIYIGYLHLALDQSKARVFNSYEDAEEFKVFWMEKYSKAYYDTFDLIIEEMKK